MDTLTTYCFLEASTLPVLMYLCMFTLLVFGLVNTVRLKATIFEKKQQGLYYLYIAFSLLSALTCVSWGAAQFLFCLDPNWFAFFLLIGLISFSLHVHFLLYIYFYRLYFIFKGTDFAVTERQKNAFYVVYFLLSVFSFLFCYVVSDEERSASLFGLFVTLSFFIIGSVLFGFYYYLFIKQLLLIARKDKGETNRLLENIAAKTFVLSCIAGSFCGVFFTVVFLVSITGWNKRMALINGICAPLELLSDYTSIALGLRVYEPVYMKLFKSCHGKVLLVTHKLSGMSQDEVELRDVMSTHDADKQTDNNKVSSVVGTQTVSTKSSDNGCPKAGSAAVI